MILYIVLHLIRRRIKAVICLLNIIRNNLKDHIHFHLLKSKNHFLGYVIKANHKKFPYFRLYNI